MMNSDMTDLPHNATSPAEGHYNFAYLDEQTKRMIRRALLKGWPFIRFLLPAVKCRCPMAGALGVRRHRLSQARRLSKVIQARMTPPTLCPSAGFQAWQYHFSRVTADASIVQTRHVFRKHR